MTNLGESELILNPDGSIYHLNLKPQDIVNTIISVGDPSRVFMVSKYFDTIDFEMNKREFVTHIGSYKGKKLAVMSTGMGGGNIEIFLNELDALANIDFEKRQIKSRKKRLKIIRIGTSAAIQEDIPLGSFLISEYGVGLDAIMCYYNLPQSEFEVEIGRSIQENLGLSVHPYVVRGSQSLLEQMKDESMLIGNTVTCAGFYAPQGREIRVETKIKGFIDKLSLFHANDFWITNLEMETAAYYGMGRLLNHDVISMNAIIANRIKNKFSKNPNKIIDQLIRKVLDKL